MQLTHVKLHKDSNFRMTGDTSNMPIEHAMLIPQQLKKFLYVVVFGGLC